MHTPRAKHSELPTTAPDVATLRGRRSFLHDGLLVLAASAAPLAADHAAAVAAPAATAATATDKRYAAGLAVLKQVGGKDYDVQLARLAELAPDMARFAVEFGYGDLVSRPGLDLPQRELCTVAALIALGSAQPQLEYHMHGFLNVGGRPEELVELLILAVALCGFPAAIDGIALARTVFAARSIRVAPVAADTDPARDRLAAGFAYLEGLRIAPLPGTAVLPGPAAQASAEAPELARWSVEFVAGDILSRRVLSEKQKHLAAISLLAATGNRTEALRWHLAAALAGAVTAGEIVEALMQLTAYAGFPAALNAFFVAREVIGHPPAADGGAALATLAALRAKIGNGAASEVQSDAQRRERGALTLAATSKQSGDAVVRGFDDLAPLLGQLLLEHSGGDIFARPGIDAKTRELAAVSALAALGSRVSETPLRVHVVAALNVGATPREIVEILYNLLPYRGYPVVQRALAVALDAERSWRAA